MHLQDPVRLRVTPRDRVALLRAALTYVDKRLDHQIRRLQGTLRAPWIQAPAHEDRRQQIQANINALRARREQCLLFEDPQGHYTWSGLHEVVGDILGETLTREPPAAKPVYPFRLEAVPPPLHPYQDEAIRALLGTPHGCVEMATGTGKSRCLFEVTRALAQPTLVMAPSVPIAYQLLEMFRIYLGKDVAGAYFDGHKDIGSPVLVAIPQALRVAPQGSPIRTDLGLRRVLLVDEVHRWAADTLSRVCLDLAAACPWRYFFSATALRTDGLDLLLKAVMGSVVFRYSLQEGVDQGYLAKPYFKTCWVTSSATRDSRDAQAMTRAHVYDNPVVNALAADIVNQAVETQGHQVVVLVEEFDQFLHLQPLINARVALAHGPLDAEAKRRVPREYWDQTPTDLVKAFNAGQVSVLIGTSCLAEGVDIQTVKTVVYLQGGTSEIQLRQALGRGTRGGTRGTVPGKIACNFIDFGVDNVPMLRRHAQSRARVLKRTYPGTHQDLWFTDA